MCCLSVYHCARFGWKVCIHSFSMNFYVFRMTQIWPLWPWPLGYEHKTSIRLSLMFYLVFTPVLRKMQWFLIFLWIFKDILNIQYSRRDLDLWDIKTPNPLRCQPGSHLVIMPSFRKIPEGSKWVKIANTHTQTHRQTLYIYIYRWIVSVCMSVCTARWNARLWLFFQGQRLWIEINKEQIHVSTMIEGKKGNLL
jgi:hypothetical protein